MCPHIVCSKNVYSQRQNILLIYDYARRVYIIGTKIDFLRSVLCFWITNLTVRVFIARARARAIPPETSL